VRWCTAGPKDSNPQERSMEADIDFSTFSLLVPIQ
jgi:hypothetical protein